MRRIGVHVNSGGFGQGVAGVAQPGGLGQGVQSSPESFNVSLPFNHQLNGFRDHHQIRIVGQQHGNSFSVNLFQGDDRPLHVNARADENILVRNSLYNGEWQHEERDGHLPWKRNELFTLDLINHGQYIEIHVNGEYLNRFNLRQQTHAVNRLEIQGDVHVHLVGVYTD
ncbi:Galectin [Aphelenchoides besseyi]|nr:Galectin [Aphelenchoides besseyi]KAI6208903.1 Galectin [Aphelenchoides besseyi]